MLGRKDTTKEDLQPVPSKRRNPVIADIFNRMLLMERKGSGFGEIIDAYRFQKNFTEDKMPEYENI